MLAMPEIHCIKFLRNHKSYSINQIAKDLKVNWRTAKKYADEAQLPEESKKSKKGMMYGSEWGEMVLDWLHEDALLKKKLRRTNKKMYETLVTYGFTGSYRTVSQFIREWSLSQEDDRRFERLEHPPGEAQVDFGTMEVVKDSDIVDVSCLVLSLPYSNRTFTVALPSENQECFFSGLRMIFEQMGGVPQSIRIDNLSAAVVQTRSSNQETIYTDAFLQFQSHYGFQVQSCNPYSGHEKGNVENKVGYVRYNFLVPSPIMHQFEDLNRQLESFLREDSDRMHYVKNVRISELYTEEEKYLLVLPEENYPIFKEKLVKVNRYGEIEIDKVKVLIPLGARLGQVRVILYWDRMKVLSDQGEILYEDQRPYMMTRRALPWKTILDGWYKKPRSFGHSRYTNYVPGRLRQHLQIENLAIRRQRIEWVLSLLPRYSIQEIDQQLYELLSHETELDDLHPYDVDWSKYDQLNRPWDQEEAT